MKKTILTGIILLLFTGKNQIFAQDRNLIELIVGGGQNLSLLQNKISHVTGNAQLGYQINRNISAGILYVQQEARNNIGLSPANFTTGIKLPGDSISFKEKISHVYTGVYANYRFFTINSVSLNVLASLAKSKMSRSTEIPAELDTESATFYQSIWGDYSANVIGLGAAADFNFNRSVSLRIAGWQRDLTGAILSGKDPNFTKEIKYADKKIEQLIMHPKAYQTIDVTFSFIFKIGRIL